MIQKMYTNGQQQKMITQKLCNYINHTYLLEIKSVQRDKAAAAHERYKYY